MKVIITGAGGQLGKELQATLPDGIEIFPFTSGTLDITNANQIHAAFQSSTPDIVINAAAFTAVDGAEQEQELAYQVNSEGAANVARCARQHGARMIHISTDFVFDGNTNIPYPPETKPNPLGVYGKSKYQGEIEIKKIYEDNLIIVRTAWVYSSHGKNFVKTILEKLNHSDDLKVVSDQIGTPTWARGLANFIWQLVNKEVNIGIFHWTDAGVASWYDFAVAIMEEAIQLNLISEPVSIIPVCTAEYPTPAQRPRYSVLDKSLAWDINGKPSPHWRISLRQMLEELKHCE